jgi:hypothetical protein
MLRKLFNYLFKDELDELHYKDVQLGLRLSTANKLVEEYKAKLAEPNRNFTVLEGFDISSDKFLGQLHEISNNKAFLFHIHALKTDSLNFIIDGDAKTAVIRQGILKGIDKVLHSLNAASKQYKELIERKENEQQVQS